MPDHEVFDGGAGPLWDLAPPADIRRRGELRARRRRRAAVAAGALAVGALVGAPTVMGIGEPPAEHVAAGEGSVPPSAAPRGDAWTRTVPVGFALDAGMGPQTHLSGRGDPALRGMTICDDAFWTGARRELVSDTVVATATRVPGSSERRVLLVYPDESTARDELYAIRRSAASCSAPGSAGERTLAFASGSEQDDWSWAYVFPGGDGHGASGGAGSLLVGRVGNGLLVDQWAGDRAASTSDEGPPEHVLGVLQEMCVFDAGSQCTPSDATDDGGP